VGGVELELRMEHRPSYAYFLGGMISQIRLFFILFILMCHVVREGYRVSGRVIHRRSSC
jgi:hypothetical protein